MAVDQKALANKLEQKAQGGMEITVKNLLASPKVIKRFEEVLKERAPQYMASIVNLWNSDTCLQECEPMTVIASCMVAATLNLPVEKNLGYAWVVPYKKRAQFQMGYKGYIQLALRTGQYRYINAIEVYEGELVKWDRMTEELILDETKRSSDKIIGYAGYFELINGFRKTIYWTADKMEAHRKRFSKSDFGWNKDYTGMSLKTILRNMLSKWGILSVEMQRAYVNDVDTKIEYSDGDDSVLDVDFSVLNEEGQGEISSDDELEQISAMMDAGK